MSDLASNPTPALSKPDTSPELDHLTPVQQNALEELVQGNSITGAAIKTGVTRATVYRWINQDHNFRALYNQWLNSTRQSCHLRLMSVVEIAADVMDRAIRNGDPNQIRRDMYVGKLEKDIELLERELTALKSPVQLIGNSIISDWYVCVRPQAPQTMSDLYLLIDSLNRKFTATGTAEQPMVLIACDDHFERPSLIKILIDEGYDAREYCNEAQTPAEKWTLGESKQ